VGYIRLLLHLFAKFVICNRSVTNIGLLSTLYWGILVTWPRQCSWGFSIRKNGWILRLYKFYSCALCRKVSRLEHFATSQSLPLAEIR